MSNTAKPKLKVTYYQEPNGDWRWTAFDGRNGRRVGGSTEGYRRKKSAVHNAEMLLGGGYAPVYETADEPPVKRRRFFRRQF